MRPLCSRKFGAAIEDGSKHDNSRWSTVTVNMQASVDMGCRRQGLPRKRTVVKS
jgi:hypothetical protein